MHHGGLGMRLWYGSITQKKRSERLQARAIQRAEQHLTRLVTTASNRKFAAFFCGAMVCEAMLLILILKT